jgi:hypothetical protein
MFYRTLLRKTAWLGLFYFAASTFVFAQGSPNIIWERNVSVDRVNSVIFTPDGNTLISGGSDRLINLWRVSDGTLLQTLNTNAAFVHESSIESLSITPDASLLASCSYKIVQLWKLPSGAMQTLNGHTDWVVGVAFSPDGKILASASFDTSVKIWRASDGALLQTIPGVAQQRCVAFSPDGSLLAIGGGEKTVRLFRTSDWTLVKTLTGHTQDIYAIAFSPDGTMIASGGYDQTVKLWNVGEGTLRYTFDGNGGNVYGVAFTPDSSEVAYTDGEGNTIRVYRTSDGALLKKFTSDVDAVQTVAFSRDGLLGYGRIDETVVLARIDGSAAARITSPSSGATFNAPANITISAAPSKSDGSITKMEFFADGTKIGEDSTSPYTFSWNGVAAGNYTLSAVDTDNTGATTRSGSVSITVCSQTNSNSAPTISIVSPGNGTTFNAPAKISISASVSADAGVASVEFFENGTSIGTDSKTPFTMDWNSVSEGNYSLTAIVTDKNGATATSAPVNISVGPEPPESVKPKISISSPKSGAKVDTPDITMTGRASDNVAVAQVLYSLNGSGFHPASGTEDWEVNLTLLPGPNSVQVKSIDTSGNESSIVTRNFTYIVSSAISLQVNGIGKVGSLKDGQILEVGKTYSIKATAGKDFIFDGWTGSVVTNAPKFSFEMTPGFHLTATFVPNPFAETQGTYYGLIQPTNFNNETTGFIRVTTSRTGTLSGKFTLGGAKYSVHGKFNGDGTFTATHPTDNFSLNLQLHFDDSEQITGSLSDDNISSAVVASRESYDSKSNPAPDAGKYTVLIPADSSDKDAPEGIGFATINVNASGSVRIAGSLADGTSFSESAGLSKNSTWPLYVPLYKNAGSISGMITFRNQSRVSDLDGTVNWYRPEIDSSKIFANGFTTKTTLIGSSYLNDVPSLDAPDREENLVLDLADGDLDSDLDIPATLLKNKVTASSDDIQNLKLSISKSSGLVNGSFVHPVTGAKTKTQGVVFQKQNLSGGYFLGTEESGSMLLTPAGQKSTFLDNTTTAARTETTDSSTSTNDSTNDVTTGSTETGKHKKHSKG